MSERTVLVVGAGIAGCATAAWLHRRGLTPVVVERAPAVRPGGAPVDLRGAGREVVERMGLLDAARAVRVDERGMAAVDASGRRLYAMPSDMFGADGPVAELEIERGDLVDLLYAATRDVVEYRFGDHVTAVTGLADGVEVTFARAAPQRFDLVVGADGLHSPMRALAFGPESEFLRPLGGYMAFCTVPRPPSSDDDDGDWMVMHADGRGRAAGLRPDRRGASKGLFVFQAEPLPLDPGDTAAQKAELARRFAGMRWEAPRLLAALEQTPDFYFDAVAQVHMDRWSSGRVVLVGDSGYCGSPLSGMGTSLALVGAYVLAGELAGHLDPNEAFAAYEQVMRPYVAQCQTVHGGLRMMAPTSRWLAWLGTRTMRLMTTRPLRGIVARTMFSTADAMTLPEYDTAIGAATSYRGRRGPGRGADVSPTPSTR